MEVRRLAEEHSLLKSFCDSNKEYALFAVGSGACSSVKHAYTNEMLKSSVCFYLCDSFSLGCGKDEALGRQHAEDCIARMDTSITKNLKKAIVVSTLGGGTGTGGAPVFAQHLSEKGIEVINIVTLPFRFEGKRCLEKSYYAVCEMSKFGKQTVIINDDMYLKHFGDKTIDEFFADIDKFIERIILNETNPDSMVVPIKNDGPWYKRIFGRMGCEGWN